jgi:hypothetical protein
MLLRNLLFHSFIINRLASKKLPALGALIQDKNFCRTAQFRRRCCEQSSVKLFHPISGKIKKRHLWNASKLLSLLVPTRRFELLTYRV